MHLHFKCHKVNSISKLISPFIYVKADLGSFRRRFFDLCNSTALGAFVLFSHFVIACAILGHQCSSLSAIFLPKDMPSCFVITTLFVALDACFLPEL